MAKGGAKILFGLFFTVVLSAGLAGGGAWYLTEHRVDGYRATVELLVEPAVEESAFSNWDTSLFVEYFKSEDVAGDLLDKVLTVYAQQSIANAPKSVEQLKEAMRVETSMAYKMPGETDHGDIIRLHYTANDAIVAAGAANAWGEICQMLVVTQLSMRDAQAREALEMLSKELEAARQNQTDLRSLVDLDGVESASRDMAKALDELGASLRQLEGKAARDDAALKALKAYVAKAPVAVALELSVREAEAEAALAGSKAESEYAAAKLAELQAAQEAVQKKLSDAMRERGAMEKADAKVALLSEKVRSMELSLPDRNARAPISVLNSASVPTAPVGPHRYVIVGGAAVLGALAGLIIYFGLLTLR